MMMVMSLMLCGRYLMCQVVIKNLIYLGHVLSFKILIVVGLVKNVQQRMKLTVGKFALPFLLKSIFIFISKDITLIEYQHDIHSFVEYIIFFVADLTF